MKMEPNHLLMLSCKPKNLHIPQASISFILTKSYRSIIKLEYNNEHQKTDDEFTNLTSYVTRANQFHV